MHFRNGLRRVPICERTLRKQRDCALFLMLRGVCAEIGLQHAFGSESRLVSKQLQSESQLHVLCICASPESTFLPKEMLPSGCVWRMWARPIHCLENHIRMFFGDKICVWSLSPRFLKENGPKTWENGAGKNLDMDLSGFSWCSKSRSHSFSWCAVPFGYSYGSTYEFSVQFSDSTSWQSLAARICLFTRVDILAVCTPSSWIKIHNFAQMRYSFFPSLMTCMSPSVLPAFVSEKKLSNKIQAARKLKELKIKFYFNFNKFTKNWSEKLLQREVTCLYTMQMSGPIPLGAQITHVRGIFVLFLSLKNSWDLFTNMHKSFLNWTFCWAKFSLFLTAWIARDLWGGFQKKFPAIRRRPEPKSLCEGKLWHTTVDPGGVRLFNSFRTQLWHLFMPLGCN